VRFRTQFLCWFLLAAVVGVSSALACGDPRRFTGASTLDDRDNSGVRYLLSGNVVRPEVVTPTRPEGSFLRRPRAPRVAGGLSPDNRGMTLDPVGHDGCADRVAAMQGRGLAPTDVRSRL
jgi:hypothetical protein